MQVKKQQFEGKMLEDMEKWTGSKLGKVSFKAVYFHCLWKSVLSTDFIFLVSKITADGDCSHEIKRHLLLGRKAANNLDSILKSRDTTLLTKVCVVKAIVFPVVMDGCES